MCVDICFRSSFSAQLEIASVRGATRLCLTMTSAMRDQSPTPTKSQAERVSCPPLAPTRASRSIKRATGQVLVDNVTVTLVSGCNLGTLQAAKDVAEFWYTVELRSQIAVLLGVEPDRVKLAAPEKKDATITDEDCLFDGAVTAIVGAPARDASGDNNASD